MSKRRKSYVPKSFESVDGNRLSANMYASMLQSKAWLSLNRWMTIRKAGSEEG